MGQQGSAQSSSFPEHWKINFSGIFYSELGLGVFMKVLDNFVSFPMALVSLENDFWFLRYDENTPRRS
ncbi:hypothetical protein MTR_6g060340 [Medicago truncatula]|uniref:Uncharacterized protein n=1 Tax=Medicago truncatula TaxID=3880 RepID=G7KNA3_MEDTR|nr:hypothetical protein MTR_6g060340 [Medicago truncatula]